MTRIDGAGTAGGEMAQGFALSSLGSANAGQGGASWARTPGNTGHQPASGDGFHHLSGSCLGEPHARRRARPVRERLLEVIPGTAVGSESSPDSIL